MNYTQLSKTISHALRHAPWVYELELDEEGWTPVETLLDALRIHRDDWENLSIDDLHAMLASAEKQRYEIQGERIRALYGHSIPMKIAKTPSEPPALLYHGTSSKVADLILKEGLRPMNRQYVHLSTDTETALEVGRRKGGKLILLQVAALSAHREGVAFYHGNEKVWLADVVPPAYLTQASY